MSQDNNVGAVCRELGVSEARYHRRLNQFGRLKAEDTKRLKNVGGEKRHSNGCWPMPSWRTCRWSCNRTAHEQRKRFDPTKPSDEITVDLEG